jgi:hypothetical protein
VILWRYYLNLSNKRRKKAMSKTQEKMKKLASNRSRGDYQNEIEERAKVIGRVAPTIKTPATSTEFTFWVKDNENIHLEIGSLVTARGENGVRVTGLVSEIQTLADIESVLDSFYAH